jgi:hypothetical protein
MVMIMADDLIYRQDAIKAIYEQRMEAIGCIPEAFNAGIDASASALEKIPSSERKGYWVYDPNGMDWNLPAWVCSECHVKNDNIPAYIRNKDLMVKVTDPFRWAGSKFCPNCGARMRGYDNG